MSFVEHQEFEFDPELSEYNPIFAELKIIKETITKKEDTGVVAFAIRKFLKAPVCSVE